MSGLDKRIAVPALTVLLGLGVLAYYLFFQGFLVQQKMERQMTRSLSDLRLANLELDTLFGDTFSYIDYDKTVKDLQIFEAQITALEGQMRALGDAGRDLWPRFEAIKEGFGYKSRIVERYKAVNAVQNNSLRYLHELYQSFPQVLRGAPYEEPVRLEMGRFLAGVSVGSLYEVGPGGWTKAQIELLKLPADHPAEELLTLFVLHAQMFIDGSHTLGELTRENRALDMEARIFVLSEGVEALFRNRQATWMFIGNLAFAMGALFFVAFVLVFIREERLKKRLEQMNQELESRVAEEMDKRHRQEQMLIQQSKLAAMGEMIGAIAHQWRQPLNTLAINIQDLEDAHNFGELNESYLKNMIARSMGLIKHMSQTINDFRNFFRQSKEVTVFDTFVAVRETLDLVRDQYRNHHIAVLLTCKPRDIREVQAQGGGVAEDGTCETGAYLGEGYLNEFKQAVLNVLGNAKDAVLERCEREPGRTSGVVVVTLSREPEWITVQIEDNGGGIPEELLERIFEPYFSTKEEGKGTGIGLYMSKTILETNMGGTLTAENGAEGALFTLRLRAAQEA